MLNDIIKIAVRYWPLFLEGLWGTFYLSVIVVFCATILGTLLSLGRFIKFKPLVWFINAYVDVIRGTPILLQIYIFMIGIGPMIQSPPNGHLWVSIALIINSSAYVAEIFRAGIGSVDKGQFEAALSLGMSEKNMLFKIILPQAIRNILPALGNEFIMMIKETSLVSLFFIPNLVTTSNIIAGNTYRTLEPLLMVGVLYYILTTILTKIIKRFERKETLYD